MVRGAAAALGVHGREDGKGRSWKARTNLFWKRGEVPIRRREARTQEDRAPRRDGRAMALPFVVGVQVGPVACPGGRGCECEQGMLKEPALSTTHVVPRCRFEPSPTARHVFLLFTCQGPTPPARTHSRPRAPRGWSTLSMWCCRAGVGVLLECFPSPTSPPLSFHPPRHPHPSTPPTHPPTYNHTPQEPHQKRKCYAVRAVIMSPMSMELMEDAKLVPNVVMRRMVSDHVQQKWKQWKEQQQQEGEGR